MRRAFTLLAAAALVVAMAPMVFAEPGQGGPPAWVADLFARSEAPDDADVDADTVEEEPVEEEAVELDPDDFLPADDPEDPVEDPEDPADEEELLEVDEPEPSTVEATDSEDVPHGWIVSTVARCAPTGPGTHGAFGGHRNHGAFVRAAAHGVTEFPYPTKNDPTDDNGPTYDLSTLDGAEALCEAIRNWDDEDEGEDEGDDGLVLMGQDDETTTANSASRGNGGAKGQAERGGGPPAHAGAGKPGAGPDAAGKGPPADRGPGRGKGGRP